MANIYTTGPAHLFVGKSGTNFDLDNLNYFGTFEQSPQISIQNLHEDVMNDIGGDAPVAKSYLGSVGTISGVLNRYDEAVYASLANGLYTTTPSRGVMSRANIGTLAQTMGVDFDVVFWFPNNTLYTVDDNPYVPPEGLHFLSVLPKGPDQLLELGTGVRKLQLTLQCIPKLVCGTGVNTSSNTNGTVQHHFKLFRHTPVSDTLKGKVC